MNAFDAACEAFLLGLFDLNALKVHAFGHAQLSQSEDGGADDPRRLILLCFFKLLPFFSVVGSFHREGTGADG